MMGRAKTQRRWRRRHCPGYTVWGATHCGATCVRRRRRVQCNEPPGSFELANSNRSRDGMCVHSSWTSKGVRGKLGTRTGRTRVMGPMTGRWTIEKARVAHPPTGSNPPTYRSASVPAGSESGNTRIVMTTATDEDLADAAALCGPDVGPSSEEDDGDLADAAAWLAENHSDAPSAPPQPPASTQTPSATVTVATAPEQATRKRAALDQIRTACMPGVGRKRPRPANPSGAPNAQQPVAVAVKGGEDEVAEFSDSDADDGKANGGREAAQPMDDQKISAENPALALADATGSPACMLDQRSDPHAAVEFAYRQRGRLLVAQKDGRPAAHFTSGAASGLARALDGAFRSEREMAPIPGRTVDERTHNRILRDFGTFPRPPANGIEVILDEMLSYMENLPAYKKRTTTAAVRSLIERCIVQRETPFGIDERRRYMIWQSARDEVHYLVEAGLRRSPTNPSLEINSRPCVMAERCMGLRLIEQLGGRRRPGSAPSFMLMGMISKAHLAAHYATGAWPAAEAGHAPCIICVRCVPHYLQCVVPSDGTDLPILVAQSVYNSVDTFHGYRSEYVLRPTGQPGSVILAPLAMWDTNAMSVYYDEDIGKHRINQDLMMVRPLGAGFDLSYFSTDVDPVDATETIDPATLQGPDARRGRPGGMRPPANAPMSPPTQHAAQAPAQDQPPAAARSTTLLRVQPRQFPPPMPPPTTTRTVTPAGTASAFASTATFPRGAH